MQLMIERAWTRFGCRVRALGRDCTAMIDRLSGARSAARTIERPATGPAIGAAIDSGSRAR
jgi:hypothetical protein